MIKHIFCSDDYYISDDGKVFDRNMHPIKINHNHKGYCIVVLKIDGVCKIFGVHTLVARAFCNGYVAGMQVNHKDGIKTNNHYTNLEWMTGKDNTRHAMTVLGHDKRGKSNPKAKAITAVHKDTNEILCFPSIIDAARYFMPSDETRARRIQNCIWKAIHHVEGKMTYRKYVWRYDDDMSNERTDLNAEEQTKHNRN